MSYFSSHLLFLNAFSLFYYCDSFLCSLLGSAGDFDRNALYSVITSAINSSKSPIKPHNRQQHNQSKHIHSSHATSHESAEETFTSASIGTNIPTSPVPTSSSSISSPAAPSSVVVAGGALPKRSKRTAVAVAERKDGGATTTKAKVDAKPSAQPSRNEPLMEQMLELLQQPLAMALLPEMATPLSRSSSWSQVRNCKFI
jgi:hypothetical protein